MAGAEVRIVDPVPRRVGLWLVVWAGLAALGGEPVRGAESRPLWRNDRLVGSPEPPLPYGVERVLGHVAWRNPMYVAPEPGTDGLWVVLQGGEPDRPSRIVRVRQSEGSDQPEPVLTIPGRLVYSVAFHPGYRTNRQFFVFSNGPTGASDRTNRISRFAAPEGREGAVDPASEIPVLSFFSAGHDGGDMAFGNDGMLFVTTGDGSSDSDTYDSGQDMSRLLAKVLRIDVDLSTSAPGYRVPKDNPFVDRPGMRPETWAYGFRNPWRMSIDERTGDLWVGQNGQDLWETAHRVGRGENMGWSVFEGNHPFHAQRRRGPTPIVPPTIEHPHSEFRSLTGGVVYYGDALPGLLGTYVYGDYATGRIWGARMVDGVLAWHRELADTSLQIAAFRVDARGQLLVVDHGGGIYRLVPRPPSDGKNGFPTKLSETGLFASVRDHRVASGLVPYSIRAAGWADGAVADRFVALPGEARIEYAPTRGWGFPDGTALVQTLSIETVVGFPESRRRVETRVLLRQENEWAGYTYRWDLDQSEARLVSKEGATVDLAIREASGGTRRQAWKIPSRTECLTCHSRAANFVLGLSTVQMARGPGESDSELERFVAANLFREAPKLGDVPSPLENPYDASRDLETRARSYLHVNCAPCHIEAGGGNARMQLEFGRPREDMALVGARPQHDAFGLVNAMLVAPGRPEGSVLVHRLSRRGPGQMPPLVNARVDERAVAVMREWIGQLRPDRAFVREWSFAELWPDWAARPSDAAARAGRDVFRNVGCLECHRHGSEGGFVGPDLTEVGKRLDRRALLESILEPSKIIEDAYAGYDFERKDGEVVSGRIEREEATVWWVRTGSAVDALVRVPKSEVAERRRSAVSNMPAGMVNVLTKDQILELLAFLAWGG